MGLLNAFLGGALGTGLERTAANINQRDAYREAEDVRLRREREQAAAREQLQDARMDAAMDRVQARIDAAAGNGNGGAGGAGAGGRRALIERDQAQIAEATAHEVAAQYRLSQPEARQAVEAYGSGVNPYTRQVDRNPNRMGPPDEGDVETVADEAKFRQIMQSVATAFKRSATAPKDAKDAAEASGLYQQQDLTGDVLAGRRAAPDVGRAVAAGEGKGAFKEGGNTLYDQFGGDNAPTAVGRAMAAEHSVRAGKVDVERRALVENGGMTPAERTGLLNSFKAAVDDAQREVAMATQRLAKAQGRKATLPADRTAKADEVAAAQDALTAATSKKTRAEQNLADMQQQRLSAGGLKSGGGGAKPDGAGGATPKPSPEVIAKDRQNALSRIGKPKRGGGVITREDVAALFRANYGEDL